MLKKCLSYAVLAASALAMLAANPSTAQSQLCWKCVLGDGNLYRCVRDFWGEPTSSVYCNDNGGGQAEPCVMGSPCEPTLRLSAATVRPDGLMMVAVGLQQSQGAVWRPLAKFSFGAALIGALSSAEADEASRGVFSKLFASVPNHGVASSDRCEGYAVARSYTTQEAESLRHASAVLTI